MNINMNALKELATSVVEGDVFDITEIAALQKAGQLPAELDPKEILDTVTSAKDQLANGDYSALTTLIGNAVEPAIASESESVPAEVNTAVQTAEDLLVASKVGEEVSGALHDDEVDDEQGVVSEGAASSMTRFRDVFGVGVGLSWDLPEVKFFDKLLNKNSAVFANAFVKLGVILDGAAENGTLEVKTGKALTDADLVDAFKVPLVFVTIKDKYTLFYVSSNPQLVGECVEDTIYLF